MCCMDLNELEALGAACWNTWTACLQRILPHGPGWLPRAPWKLASSGPGQDVGVQKSNVYVTKCMALALGVAFIAFMAFMVFIASNKHGAWNGYKLCCIQH